MFRNICIILSILLLFSCSSGKTYRNYDAKYQLKYPKGWLALNSKQDREGQSRFLSKIAGRDTLISHKGVDAVFVDPTALPPDYGFVSVNSINSFVNLNKVNITFIEELLLLDLSQKFENITIAASDFKRYGKFKAYRMDFNFHYQNTSLMATTVIIQGNLFSTQILTTIYKTKDQAQALSRLEEMLASYKRI